MTIYLALLIGCGWGCAQHYEVFHSLAQCEVRVAEWDSSGSVFNQPGRSGFCQRKENVTDDDVAIYVHSGSSKR